MPVAYCDAPVKFIASLSLVLLVSGSAAAQTPIRVITDALEGNNGRSSGIGALRSGDPEVVLAVLKQETTTLPLGSSSGGFTWEFDPVIGLVVRKAQSFGAIFTDRPQTIGHHKLSVGITTQHTAWQSLAGQNLRDGSLFWSDKYLDQFYTDKDEFNLDKGISTVDLATDRTTINATFGITSRLDLNAIVPFGRTRVAGAFHYSTIILSSGKEFSVNTGSSSAVASGMADITVKGKYQLISRGIVALAAAAELRLPTGNPDNLLGTGTRSEKVSVIGSTAIGRYNPHLEAGYLFAGQGLQFKGSTTTLTSVAPSDEMMYAAGVDAALTSRVTVAADLVGRTLRHSAKIVRTDQLRSYPYPPPIGSFIREGIQFHAEPGAVSILLGSVGGKLAVGSSWLLTGSLLFPLNDAGIKPGVTPVIGFERAF